MPVAPGPSRRFVIILLAVSFCLAFAFVSSFRSQAQGVRHPLAHGSGKTEFSSEEGTGALLDHSVDISPSTLTGHVIAPKLGNETIKYVSDNMEKLRIPDTLQGRTRSRGLEALPHHLCSLPG